MKHRRGKKVKLHSGTFQCYWNNTCKKKSRHLVHSLSQKSKQFQQLMFIKIKYFAFEVQINLIRICTNIHQVLGILRPSDTISLSSK